MSINEIFDFIIASKSKKFNGIYANVIAGSVDTVNKICDVLTIQGDSIYNVRLLPATTSGLFIKPAPNSFVIVHSINDHEYYVSMFSEFDEIDLGDGSFGGIPNAIELKTQLDKTNVVVNAIKSALTGWTVAPGDGGAALKVAAATAIGTNTVGDYSNIQNAKVKHGV